MWKVESEDLLQKNWHVIYKGKTFLTNVLEFVEANTKHACVQKQLIHQAHWSDPIG